MIKTLINVLCGLYGWLIHLYPPGFRARFGEEMQAVFEDAVTEAGTQGFGPLAVVWFRELRDWPGAVGAEYRAWLLRIGPINIQGGISLMKTEMIGTALNDENNSRTWTIDARGRAILAALPPLVLGIGVALPGLVGGGSWFDLALWQKVLMILLTLLPVGMLGIGGLIALLRMIPDWGYTWAGSALLAGAVSFKILVEERADVGAAAIAPGGDVVSVGLTAVALMLVLAGGLVLLIAALRGWAQAGLTSIGFVATFGITTLSMVRAAPFNRNDLLLLAAPLGILQACLTYIYVRGRGTQLTRWLYLLSIWVLNGAPILLAHHVVWPWLAVRGRPSPLIPLLVIVTVLAWAGPLAGVLGRPVRRVLGRG